MALLKSHIKLPSCILYYYMGTRGLGSKCSICLQAVKLHFISKLCLCLRTERSWIFYWEVSGLGEQLAAAVLPSLHTKGGLNEPGPSARARSDLVKLTLCQILPTCLRYDNVASGKLLFYLQNLFLSSGRTNKRESLGMTGPSDFNSSAALHLFHQKRKNIDPLLIAEIVQFLMLALGTYLGSSL